MKRVCAAAIVAIGLVTLGCQDDPDKINAEGITGHKDANAPTTQQRNTGTEKQRPSGDMPKGDMPKGGGGGFAKKGGAAFPPGPNPLRPDQLPKGYPQPEGEVKTADGKTSESKGNEAGAPAGDAPKTEGAAPAGDAPKGEGDAPKEVGDATKVALTDEDKANIAKLSEEDQKAAVAQLVCLISGEPLGSMGVPIRVEHEGKVGFLCCGNCKKEFNADPAKALAKTAK